MTRQARGKVQWKRGMHILAQNAHVARISFWCGMSILVEGTRAERRAQIDAVT